MGNPCSSGIGLAKPGSGSVAFLTNLAIGVVLARYGYEWLATIVTALPAASFDTDSFCNNGQPALPTITESDLIALSNPVLLADFAPAAQKVKDVALYYLWYELCYCQTGTTPEPSAAQTPVDVVAVGSASSGCATLAEAGTETWDVGGTLPQYLFAGRWAWGPRASGSHTYDFPSLTIRKVHTFGSRTRGGSGTHDSPMEIRFRWTDISIATVYRETHLVSDSADSWDFTDIAPPNAEYCEVAIKVSNINTADSVTYDGMAFCDDLPTGGFSGCCPPDTSIAAAIAALQADLALAKTQIDLIQRQGVPFGFVEGSTHGGLTGNGHVTVADLIGAKIVLQTIPDYIGYQVGDTYEVFTDSWINWGNGGYSAPREWIRGYLQMSFPRNAGTYDSISYSLAPGLEIAIVELLREP